MLLGFACFGSFPLHAQINHSLKATITHNAGGGTGVWDPAHYGDGDFSTAGWSNGAGGTGSWIEWDWGSTPVTFNELVFYHYTTTNRFLQGADIWYWDAGTSSWVTAHTFSNLPLQSVNTVTLPVPVTTTRMRITNWQMAALTQASNPNFWEIEVILKAAFNLSASALVSPESGCGLTSSEPIEIQIVNGGSDTIHSGEVLDLSYQVDNNQVFTETITLAADLPSSASLIHTFSQAEDLSAEGTYNLKAWVKNTNDSLADDDTLFAVIEHVPFVTNFPYHQGFEAGTGGWTTAGPQSGLWELGVPGQGFGAANGTKAWMTDLTGNYPDMTQEYLVSPCFDFSNVTIPFLSFFLRMDTEVDWDGMTLEYTTDGTTWTKTGGYPGFYNNMSGLGYVAPPKWSGNNNGWAKYETSIRAVRGESSVRFRFNFHSDDFVNAAGIAVDSINVYDSCSFVPGPAPVANFQIPDTVYVNSPTLLTNLVNHVFAFTEWYVDGVNLTNTTDLLHTFPSTGTYDVKMRSFTCFGWDSITKTVTVRNPTRAPQPLFISDKNVVTAYEEVRFTELSEFGPTNWEWIISPAYNTSSGFPLPSYTFLDGTNEFSQHPVISFDFPGVYDVCLVASNSVGSDTLCNQDYITVRSTNYMCIFPYNSEDDQGALYDDGGPLGDYSNNNNCGFLIDPCGAEITLSFSQFDLQANVDYLRVYDGADNTGTPLWDVSVNANGMTGSMVNSSFMNNLVAQSGQMYVEFQTNGNTTASGFQASWSTTPSMEPQPTVDFDMPDTVCVNIPVVFENTSVGSELDFNWDLYNDQFPDAGTEDFQFTFNTAGTYTLKLTGENCGGMDSVIKNVVVVTPQRAPSLGFMVRNRRPAVNEVVTLQDTTSYCADSWEWTISPNTYQFVNGTDEFSQHPQVIFTDTGYYDVTLEAGNSFGQASITRNDYFYVIDYCRPIVGNLSSDVGISRVQLEGINQASTIGDVAYTDYSAGNAAMLKEGAHYLITVERMSASNAMQRAAWIDFNQDGDFADAGEQVLWESASYSLSYTDSFQVPRTATLGATRMRVGARSGTSNLAPCGPVQFGEYEDYQVVISADVTVPVITLLGDAVDTIAQCETYVDSGATAWDNIDGDISGQIIVTGSVDETVAGTYTLSYNVSDITGNPAATVMRTVVVLPDSVAPVLTLNGISPDTIEVGVPYTDPGASAMDNCDSSVAVTVAGSVDVTTVGTYVLTYTAEDTEGNMAVETRLVVVEDATAPTITLQGGDTLYVQVDSTWTDPGVQTQDNYDTSLTLTTTGNVNTSVIGTYTISYCVMDASGNGPVCEDRVVIVEDLIAPTVELLWADTIQVEVGTNFFDPGVDISDNYYSRSELVITTGGNWPGNADVLGTYTIEYTVTDPSGNSTTVVRVVEVVDTEAPTINLLGPVVVNLVRWTTWTDPGVEVEDNYNVDSEITIEIDGDIDLDSRIDLPIGTYYVNYTAVDESGNRSPTVSRIVHVIASGVAEAIPGATIEIFPNPTSDQFTLKLELAEREQVQVSILNMQGKEVKLVANAQMQATQLAVPVSDLPSGVYFVRVVAGGNQSLHKLVITR